EALLRRQREAQIEEGIARVKSLLLLEQFDEAIAILTGLQAECPDSALVDHWLGHARTQQAETERQKLLHARMADARTLIAQRRLSDAITVLGELSTQFPGETQVAELLAQA